MMQHYVWQHCLRQFLNNGYFHVLDKCQKKQFSTTPKSIMGENDFYVFGGKSYEALMCKIENEAQPAYNDMMRLKSPPEDIIARKSIARYCAAQCCRTKAMREDLKDIDEQLKIILPKKGLDPNFLMLTDVENKLLPIEMIDKIYPVFMNKVWDVLEAPPGHYFMCSDNPLVLGGGVTNSLEGVGLGSDGTVIYLPLSSRLCLVFLCPRLAEVIKASNIQIDHISVCNWMQFVNAERFVVSYDGNFSEMLKHLQKFPERVRKFEVC